MYPRLQPPIALSYTTAWSNIVQYQMWYTRLRKLSSLKKYPPPLFNIWNKIQDPLVKTSKSHSPWLYQCLSDLQGFIVGKKFVVKEVAVLRKGAILFHYIFTYPMPWNFLTKSEKYCASWLSVYRHGLQWEDGMIPYSMAKHLITMAVIGSEESDNKIIVYVVKDMKNANDWLMYSIATRQLRLVANYEDRDSLILIFEILISLIL